MLEVAGGERPDVLVVDDQPANLAVLGKLLGEGGYSVRGVTSGARALEAAARSRPDCILLDVSMPDMDGLATCAAFQADPTLRDVPVVFLTAHDDVEHKILAFQAGGRDYITKPFQAEEVLARVRNHVCLAAFERQLKTQNEALRESNVRLQEASQLKARLTAMLVHDLRSPLTVIGLVLEGINDADSIADARAAHDKVTRLVSNMLELSRSEHAEIESERHSVDLWALLERVVRLSQRVAATRGVTMNLEPSPVRVAVAGDPAQLDRVFSNLLDNALKFTPAGGTIGLTLRAVQGEGVEAGLHFAAVSVVDTGPGIPAADLPFLFEAYHQSTSGRRPGGFGLGLAIVARIVALHGGRIRVQSQVGVGTELRVMLPLVVPTARG